MVFTRCVAGILALLVILPFTVAAAPTPTPASAEEQLSETSGIGTMRAEVLDAWGISPSATPVLEFTVDHKQDITYDPPDRRYQVSFVFQLQEDDEPRDSDRMIFIVVSLMSSISVSAAERMAEEFLPDDAERVGRPTLNRFGEPVQLYRSDAIAELFPDLEMEGDLIEPAGRIWVTLYPPGSRVTVVEVSLFDSSEY